MESKVKSVQASGTFNSDYGMLYKFLYEMEDGVSIQANHKTDKPRFSAGDTVEYIVTGSRDGQSYGKVSRPENNTFTSTRGNQGKQGKDQDVIGRQWAINSAMRWIVDRSVDPSKDTLRDVAACAKALEEMRDDLDSFITKYSAAKVAESGEDLPF